MVRNTTILELWPKQNANVFIKQTKDYDKLLGHKRLLRKFKITSNFRKGMYAVYMTQYL